MKRFENPLSPRINNLKVKSDEIKTWVREVQSLPKDTIITIAELACRDEGCPDIETVIGVLEPNFPIRTIRVHCGLKEMTKDTAVEAIKDQL